MNNFTHFSAFNEVIASYNLQPFSVEEFTQITEIFDNISEHEARELAEDFAIESITFDYENMYR